MKAAASAARARRKRSEAAKRGWETRRSRAAATATGSALRARDAEWFARRISELSAVIEDKRTTKKDRAAAEALRAELLALRDRTLTNARPTEAGASGALRTYGEAAGGAAFPESRHFSSGPALLGFLEGRPGITRILAVEAFTPGAAGVVERTPPEERPAPDAELLARVETLELVQGAPEGERAAYMEAVLDAYWECDDGGAFVEVEVEYEEAAA